MGLLTGKVFLGLLAGTITVSAGTFAVSNVELVKQNIDRLEDAYNLLSDEASQKIGGANSTIAAKNTEITALLNEVNRLESELEKANVEVTKGNTEITEANAEINKANSEVANLANLSDAAADRVEAADLAAQVVDTQYQVSGAKLSFTILQGQDETSSRTLRLFNPNTAAVQNVQVISTKGDVLFTGTLQGGEYKTFEKNNSGEMLKLVVNGKVESTK